MTTTRLYQSTDSGAPTLTGQVGSLISLLKTCLVGTAGVAYNGRPAAGWTNPYDDPTNNITVLRADPAYGSGCYVRILDDGTGTSATAANAHINCYSSMSGISTGNDQTPASVAGWPGARVEKSSAANATAVPWVVVADQRTAYLATLTTTVGSSVVYGFGDYESFAPGFGYPIFCAGGRPSVTAADRASAFGAAGASINDTTGLINLMRDYTASPGAVKRSAVAPRIAATGSTCIGSTAYPSPNAALSNAILSSPALVPSAAGVMGRLRGFALPLVNVTDQTMPSMIAGAAPGSMLVLLRQGSSFGNAGANFNGGVLIETSLPWE